MVKINLLKELWPKTLGKDGEWFLATPEEAREQYRNENEEELPDMEAYARANI